MTDATTLDAHAAEPEFCDFVALLKPRVMRLVVFTALAAMVAAPAGLHPVVAFAAIVCIAVGAGASGALNMWWDADIDAEMGRTASRPVPSGTVAPGDALALGIVLSVLSVAMLAVVANPLAAGLLAFTIFFYAVIYSMWLKRSTPQNIVIGGAAGAFPPLIAWAAATGDLGTAPALMFLVIFLWTPPHFWALALFRQEDYARVSVPMLPVVAGEAATRRQIVVYAALLTPAPVALAFSEAGGPVTLVAALTVGAAFLYRAWRVGRRTETAARTDGYRAEKRLFGLSIVYLFVLFSAVMADALLGALVPAFAWPVLL